MKQRVIDTARALGLEIEMRSLAVGAGKPDEVCSAIGCSEGQIAQAVAFVADGDPVLVIASGARWIDLAKLCDAFDCAEIRQATPAEVRAATGGSADTLTALDAGLPVAFDRALLDHERIYAQAGDGSTLFEVNPSSLARAVHALVMEI
ncbi:MAG: YbaK/EbsC family protein [Thermoleophilaceae bacterium]